MALKSHSHNYYLLSALNECIIEDGVSIGRHLFTEMELAATAAAQGKEVQQREHEDGQLDRQ